jgi:purine-cytosine permease-like protein
VLVAATATCGAIAIDLGNYLTFLFLLGSVFVPLFGVLLADWLTHGAHYGKQDIFDAPVVRWERLAAWVAGFGLYQWLSPVGPTWWTGVVGHLSPGHARLTASLPSFAVAFGLTLLAAWVDSRRAAARSRREPLARPR